MDLRPWDQWTPEGQAQPGTDEILATLDAVMKMNPNHPFANHLYIHAVEASPNPERADAAADRLRTLQPGLAHNVHMPSHIDIRRGRWQKASRRIEKAVDADQRYRKITGPPKGFLNVYTAHNRHMLAYAAMMTGQSKLAMKHIRAMVAESPADFVKETPEFAEGFAAMPLEVLVRFGRWDEILAERDNYPEDSISRALSIMPREPPLMPRKATRRRRGKSRLSSRSAPSWCRPRRPSATTSRARSWHSPAICWKAKSSSRRQSG